MIVFSLRIPKGTKQMLEELAKKNMRSLNSEILIAIEEKLTREELKGE